MTDHSQRLSLTLSLDRNCETCKHRRELHHINGMTEFRCAVSEVEDNNCDGKHYEWDGVSSDYDEAENER
ncbi:MAG: hypothetical protein UY48_C0043G0002 [Candidatus Gottesmanbacteria bacterium GW2011_GWB1_49_7]|uniref:Uncharacterized protein n=1 Tax=Candidatus Gottesmanbacteria bacterium GW2011_GWB1_49_7 TaxID=1618448 RepID=A0A0G1Y5T8_9BACT|nr:MAG: hypothetical protein UY48_C0043G0002 [Candidatus Gottesmanbacteria bacterium GW2011_GWB1_49_7]